MGNKQEEKNSINVLKSPTKKSINNQVNRKTNNQKNTGFNKNTNNQKKTGVNKKTNTQKKAGVNIQKNNQKKIRAKKVTEPNEAAILGIGYRALNKKLKDIFNILCTRNDSFNWPQMYINPIMNERSKWVLYSRLCLASMRHVNKDRNIALINHASLTFLSLPKQSSEIWDLNLWVILCEYISEMVKNEAQYDRIIEVVLLAAKHETTCLKKRLENLISLVTEDPWWMLFKKIERILTDVCQKCELYILCFALSEQQRARIFTHLSTKNNNEGENLLSHLNLLMTQVRLEKLLQVTDLLKNKRGLLRMLSSETLEDIEFEGQESPVTTCTTADHIIEDKPDVKYEQGPVNANHSKEHVEEQTALSLIVAECVNIQLGPNTKQKKDGNEFLMRNDHKFSQGIVSHNTSSCVEIALDPDADVYQTIKVEDNSVTGKHDIKELTIPAKQLIDVKNEPKIVTEINDVKQENLSYDPIKVEDGAVIDECDIKELTIPAKQLDIKIGPNIVTETKAVKQEKVKEEDSPEVVKVSPPDIIDVKSEKLVEESVSDVQANDQASQDQQVQKKQNTENDITSSLDKLILQMSFQQINKSILSNTIIEVSEDEDDDDDCMIQEDRKLEVGQLLNMYCEIVSDQPKRIVKNPLADQKNVEKIQIETKHFIKLCDDESFAVSQGIPPNIHERNPSTTSNTSIKSSKMKVQMSTQKQQKQIRRNQSKTNAKVKKLFEKLRNESQMSCSAEENSVVVLDDNITPKKRKRKQNNDSPKCNKKGRYFGMTVPDSSTFLAPIDVEGSIVETNPIKQSSMHCSTPITKKKTSQSDFIPIISKNSKPENNIKSLQNFNEEVTDLTKEINRDSFLTIDLTTESLNCSSISKPLNTVIDLDSTVDTDCTVVAVDNDNLSISGESDVTVINMGQAKKDRQMRKFVKGISKLDAAEKGKLLELITQNIFSGCSVVDKKKSSLHNVPPAEKSTRATETAEDTYIKEVILGQTASRNSIGSNIYNPERDRNRTGLRMIVIDGSNVAVEHGRKKVFSVKGLKICIDYFLKRGHVVKAFVPRFRCKFNKSTDPRLLDKLEEQGHVVYTPSREVQGRMITPYDDRYIVQCAAEFDGVIVSGDNYRDLISENPRWRFIIENRLLMFTWVHDMIMFPKDPLGRNGPTLEQFLRHRNQSPQAQNIPQQPLTYAEELREYESLRQLPKTYSQPPHMYSEQPQTSNPDEENFPRH